MLLLLLFTFFNVFSKFQKVVTFYVYCRVSYLFSNYGYNGKQFVRFLCIILYEKGNLATTVIAYVAELSWYVLCVYK